jgi:uncharacterized protein YbaR (Trm112 family)
LYARDVALDPALLAILACPEDKGPLLHVDDEGGEFLYNPRLHRRYDVRDGIPVMLVGESTVLNDVAHDDAVRRAAARG